MNNSVCLSVHPDSLSLLLLFQPTHHVFIHPSTYSSFCLSVRPSIQLPSTSPSFYCLSHVIQLLVWSLMHSFYQSKWESVWKLSSSSSSSSLLTLHTLFMNATKVYFVKYFCLRKNLKWTEHFIVFIMLFWVLHVQVHAEQFIGWGTNKTSLIHCWKHSWPKKLHHFTLENLWLTSSFMSYDQCI